MHCKKAFVILTITLFCHQSCKCWL